MLIVPKTLKLPIFFWKVYNFKTLQDLSVNLHTLCPIFKYSDRKLSPTRQLYEKFPKARRNTESNLTVANSVPSGPFKNRTSKANEWIFY